MSEPPSLRGTPALHEFLEALSRRPPELGVLEVLLVALRNEHSLERALFSLKQQHPRSGKDDPWHPIRLTLETEVASARQQRIHEWQMDPRRRTLRLRMEIRHPACRLHPPALQGCLAKAMLDSGLPVAMSLEKSARPMIHLGHPLPSNIEGLSEWADAILREPVPVSEILERITSLLPEGLKILDLVEIPNLSSPVLELCREAHWKWVCPQELQVMARERLAQFETSKTFTIQKMGKVEGQKQAKRVEVRSMILSMGWDQELLRFSTRIAPGEAMNPVKLLAGILELDPSSIQGLTRERVDLSEDPRLVESGKYETKLHNIYEDAVLLEGGPHIQIEDDEDDEPILIQRKDPER